MVLTIERLINRRKVVRTKTTEYIAAAEGMLQNPDATPTDLQLHINIIRRQEGTIIEMDANISELIEDLEVDTQEVTETEEFRTTIVTILSNLYSNLKIKEMTNAPPNSEGSVHNNNESTANHQVQVSRLPQLNLPKFSGDPLSWMEFWDSYESAIHSRDNLSNVDKFNYLRSLLKGVAADAIGGLATTNSNYGVAIDIINQRFGQPQTIINAHVEALVNIPRTSDETSKLRALYDHCEIHIRGLESILVAASANGTILTSIIFAKLPEEVRMTLTLCNGNQISDLKVLRNALRGYIEAREVSHVKKVTPRPENEERKYTTGSFISNSRTGNQSRFSNQFCQLCRTSGHWTTECPTYTTRESRLAVIKQRHLCENCLRGGHLTKDCRSKFLCKTCNQRHHTLVCSQKSEKRNDSQRAQDNVTLASPSENSTTNDTTTTLLQSATSIWMQTALAKIRDGNGRYHLVRLLFDTGSHRSYITSSLAEKLSLKAERSEVLRIAPFGQLQAKTGRFDVTSVECRNLDDTVSHQIQAVVTPVITCPIYRAKSMSKNVFSHLKLADPPSDVAETIEIDMLIGLDYYWQIVTNDVIRAPGENITAVASSFGWLISGVTASQEGHPYSTSTLITASMSTSCTDLLQRFWDSENIPGEFESTKSDNDLVLKGFNESIEKHDNRYVVKLPWKYDTADIPSNYSHCKARFRRLLCRLNRESLLSRYNEVIADQLKRKFIEPIDNSEKYEGQVHYISHHPVIKNDNTTTKLRIVYDASAKMSPEHSSLNESLHVGPNMVSDMMGLLLEFRTHKIVLLADIEKAFLQVGLHESDRDVTRFFWLKDPSKPAADDNIQIYRFCRVLFGATCSPFLLAATIKHHLQQHKSAAATQMLNRFYVDNLMTGAETLEEAKSFYKEAKMIMNEASMNLREWVSNSNEFFESVPIEDRHQAETTKVLGINWNVFEDTLSVKGVPNLINVKPPTKRTMLQTIACIFDPLGLISPVVITSKMILQELWKQNVNWDTAPDDELLTKWKAVNEQLSMLDQIHTPRKINPDENSELHVFVDASPKAYGAVAYVKTSTGVEMVCSKSRLAPIKELTIPRLELMAALLGVKLAKMVQTTFTTVKTVQLWSDSQVVIYWIRGTKSKELFVRNRVKVLKEYGYTFRYCPTQSNPADWVSRGKSVSDLVDSTSIWWKGPSWLSEQITRWPQDVMQPQAIPIVDIDQALTTAVQRDTTREQTTPFTIDPHRFSTLQKLLRVTVLCKRFVDRLRKIKTPQQITGEDLADASSLWIKYTQRYRYQQEYNLLLKNGSSNMTRKMHLYLENGIIKCRGRFSHSALTQATNCPILLPKKDRLTDLIIDDVHRKLLHAGVNHTLTEIRQLYWIPCGRQQVRNLLKRCHVCIRWEGRSYSSNLPQPPLPPARVTKNPAFSYTGCDFAGPLYVSATAGHSKKVYICLFTCAVTRAIHLELVEDLTTLSFIAALRRFISRRGVPLEIISDNATVVNRSFGGHFYV